MTTKNNRAYWEKRMLEEEAKSSEKSAELLSRIQLEYKAGQREIDRQLKALYETYGEENGVSASALRKGLSGKERQAYEKKVEELLKASGKYEERKARNQYLSGRITRLEALRNQAELEIERISVSQDISILRHLREVYEDSYYHNAFYSAKAGIAGNFNRLNPYKVEEICKIPWSGKNFSERIWANTDKLKLEVRRLLSTGSICGTPVKVTSQKLASRMGVSYRRAETLVRTESAYIREKATMDGYQNHNVKRYRILATLDNRTSSICQAMDGKEFDIEDAAVGENYPPLHPNCRSTTVPVYKDFNIASARAAKDSDKKPITVPNDMTYPEWYETYIAKAAPAGDENIKPTPAKRLAEAGRYAMEVLGIALADYTGLDAAVAEAWNDGLKDNLERFPELRERNRYAGEAHRRNELLRQDAIREQLLFYKKIYPNMDEDVLRQYAEREVEDFMEQLKIPKKAVAANWPTEGVQGKYAGIAINKETGKSVSEMVKELQEDVAIRYHPAGCDTIRYVVDHELGHQLDDLLGLRDLPEIQELFDSRTKEELTEALSQYAWENSNQNRYAEMIAEAWAEYCNNPTPREIAQKVGTVVEREYAKRFGKG